VKRISIDNSARRSRAGESSSNAEVSESDSDQSGSADESGSEDESGSSADESSRSVDQSGSNADQSRSPDPRDMTRQPGQRQGGRGTRRSSAGIGVGMIAGALVAIGTFLPWLEFNGRIRSGWEIYDVYSSAGSNPAVISPMFGGGDYDIFFTGLVTLALGVLSLLLLAALIAIQKKPSPKQGRRILVLTASATLAIAAALVVAAINLRTAQLGTLGFERAGVHYGLWVIVAASWAGTLGMAVSITGKRWRMPEPTSTHEVAAAGVESAASAPEQVTSRSGAVASAPEPAASGVEHVIASLRSPDARSRPAPAASRSGPRGQGLIQLLALSLFLVGIGGFVVAAAGSQSIQKTAVPDARALGGRDPAAASVTLRAGFTSVDGAYNAYAASTQRVARARAVVVKRLATVEALSKTGKAGLGKAKSDLTSAMAAHELAIEEERIARRVYVDRLAALMKDVHP
jgi:hypothetical protein